MLKCLRLKLKGCLSFLLILKYFAFSSLLHKYKVHTYKLCLMVGEMPIDNTEKTETKVAK